MRHQTIEEAFRSIKPRQRGVPAAAPISVGIASSGSGFSDSLSQAAKEISQLRASYQSQADLIAANTTALEKNASSSGGQSGGGSLGGTVKSVGQSLLGGGVLGMIPLISGIAKLFGGGSSAPAPLPTYLPPPSIQLDSTIRNSSGSVFAGSKSEPSGTDLSRAKSSQGLTSLISNDWNSKTGGVSQPADQALDVGSPGRSNTSSNDKAAFSPQVTVNISAMDSQSFLDRSADIASAVREAVLNLHPLNSVLADL